MKTLSADEFLCFDDVSAPVPVTVDLVYAGAAHPENIFKTALYRPDAKLWCHKDLLSLTLRAAEICYQSCGHYFEIKDSLRPVEAQQKMIETEIVRQNPHWLKKPDNLLSLPGEGGHPRGMAIDIVLIDENGERIDMGTPFDYFSPDPAVNPAARNYTALPPEVLQNRRFLEDSMMQAAQEAGQALLPLPQEWWDFRFPARYTNSFTPVSDKILPPHMQMVL